MNEKKKMSYPEFEGAGRINRKMCNVQGEIKFEGEKDD